MAEIAKPFESNNQFNKVEMYRPAANKQNAAPADMSDQLNKMVGRDPEEKFVDRKNHNKMDKDAFLKLLSHQLANQDPMQPMDQKQFAADLAQFSQLEQITNMNAKLDNLKLNNAAQGKFYGASFLGKKVITQGTSIDHPGGRHNVRLPFYLPKAADNTIVRIYDSKKQMVAQLEPGKMSSGGQSVEWDGMALDGAPATKDTYSFEVLAFTDAGDEFKAQTRAEGVVTGVSFEEGETILEVDKSKKVFLRDVHEFQMGDKVARGENIPALPQKAIDSYNKNNVTY